MTAPPDAGPTLLPCPWCDPLKAKLIGGPLMVAFGNEIKSPGIENWHGFCRACGAEGPKEASMEAGRAAWNRRAPGEREIERLREWQRRAWVVIECPSSDTIQDELKWLREASKP